MAANGGGHVFWGITADQEGKKDCGLKMAADGGSVFFGGRPLTRKGKRSRAQRDKDDQEDVGNVAFNEDNTKADIKTKNIG